MLVSETRPTVEKHCKQRFPSGPILRKIEELEYQNLRPEAVYELPDARVVFANYELLQHDFPHLRDEALERKHPELQHLVGTDRTLAIRRLLHHWLKANVAFISENQSKQTWVNTHIKVTSNKVRAFRPPRYGRALVVSLKENQRTFGESVSGPESEEEEGLLDIKGVGVASDVQPSLRPQSNGLMFLGEAFREVVFQEIMSEIFRHEGASYQTVPLYGVLDLGFDIKLRNGGQIPAGMLVRRAHRRKLYERGFQTSTDPETEIELQIELLLRKYGFTSVSNLTTIETFNQIGIRYGSKVLDHFNEEQLEWIRNRTHFKVDRKRYEGPNIQFTREVSSNPPQPQIIDYGGFRVKKRFEHPIVCLVSDKPLRMGKIIHLDNPRFVQPDEKLCAPYAFWGTTPDGKIWGYSAFDTGLPRAELQVALTNQDNPEITDIDNPKILGFNLAREFREGKLSGPEVRDKLNRFVQTATSRW